MSKMLRVICMTSLTAVLFFFPLVGCENQLNGSRDNTETPGNEGGDPLAPSPDSDELGPVAFRGAEGWRETLYVTWYKLEGAMRYNVYYRNEADNDWIKIDDQLIREYEGGYLRADVLGIPVGIYDIKVIPVASDGKVSPNYAIWRNIQVTAHTRTGFAFTGADHPGAYNMDGTPRANARIIYVTNDNKNTITLNVRDDNNRWVDRVGVADIITGHANRAWDERPLIIRFVGKITAEGFAGLNSDRQLQLNSGGGGRTNAPITLEGVGNDATAFGWGIRINGTRNVEIRNLGFMLRNHNTDSVDIDGSRYVWVHHNDFFYGRQGSGDFEKGDGDLDIRRSSHVTVSFNHFWDTGKTSLLGTQIGETPGFITYHNNHFNHSDGRHPRVRAHQVHMFNNLFDHIAQYAIGAAGGAPSIFAEANYFRRTRNPMLISMQGTDVEGGSGTFSSEDGGMIKAYNNFMCDWTLQHFSPWSPSNTEQFDAFIVQSRNELVPSSVVSRQGGHAFSNFDQNLGYTYTVRSPADARDHVLRYAGRFWGGEIGTVIPFAFGPADVGTARERRNPELDAILSSYQSRMIAIQGEDPVEDNNDEDPVELPPPVNGVRTYNFSIAPFTNWPLANNTVGSLVFGASFTRNTSAASGGGETFTHRLNQGGNGTGQSGANHANRRLEIALEGPSTITIFATSNASGGNTLHMFNGANDTGNVANSLQQHTLPGWSSNISLGHGVTFTSNTDGPHSVVLRGTSDTRYFMIRIAPFD